MQSKQFDNNPIGVFDSGIGGLSLLKELKTHLPMEKIIYFGDNQNAPYGNLTDKEIFAHTEKCVRYLILKRKCKMVVLACNTATAVSAQRLREMYSVPIIGVEPAVKPAACRSKTKKVLLLATEATIRNRQYNYPDITITYLGCKHLAAFLEENYYDDEKVYRYIDAVLSPYRGCGYDSVVLGCTHYVLKKEIFEKICGCSVTVYDGNSGTVNYIAGILDRTNSRSCYTVNKRPQIVLSCDDGKTREFYRKILRGE